MSDDFDGTVAARREVLWDIAAPVLTPTELLAAPRGRSRPRARARHA